MSSPTQRTLKALRAEGYTAAVTERWNPFARRRVDLFGFIDVLAVRPNMMLAVQTTSAAHHADRRAKVVALHGARAWLEAGGLIEIWSWRKKGRRWISRREPIELVHLVEPDPPGDQVSLKLA